MSFSHYLDLNLIHSLILFIFAKKLYSPIILSLLSFPTDTFPIFKGLLLPLHSMVKEQPWVCCFIINQILITSVLSRYSSYGHCWPEYCLWHSYIRDYIQSMVPEMKKSYCLPLAMQTKLLIRAVPQVTFKEGPKIHTHLCKVL